MDAASYTVALDTVNTRTQVSCQQQLQYAVAWRQRKLIVRSAQKSNNSRVFVNIQGEHIRLLQCLNRSPIEVVLLDSSLGAADLQAWADICSQAGKTAYLRGPSTHPRKYSVKGRERLFQRILNLLLALILIILLSPIFLLVSMVIAFTSSGPIFLRQWHVRYDGKMYKQLRFALAKSIPHDQYISNAFESSLPFSRAFMDIWLEQYNIAALPKLINVFCGDLNLITWNSKFHSKAVTQL